MAKSVQVRFHVHYDTQWGESIVVLVGGTIHNSTLPLEFVIDGLWEAEHAVAPSLTYRYAVRTQDGSLTPEDGPNRCLNLDPSWTAPLAVRDQWQSASLPEYSYEATAVFRALAAHPVSAPPPLCAAPGHVLRCRVRATVPRGAHLALVGAPPLGAWDPQAGTALRFDGADWVGDVTLALPTWTGHADDAATHVLHFKFVQRGPDGVVWEAGENRRLEWRRDNPYFAPGTAPAATLLHCVFRHARPLWRAAGVAVPVFALRTERGLGVGEFADLATLAGLARRLRLRVVQVLPVNDTHTLGRWTESYPYSAVSVFALHPLYANVSALTTDNELLAEHAAAAAALNALPSVDYEAAISTKLRLLRLVWERSGEATLMSADCAAWQQRNEWLRPYALFTALRREHGHDFTKWPEAMRRYNAALAPKLESEYKSHIAFTVWLQYVLHSQLAAASAACAAAGVALKGDLPIGVNPLSCDVWQHPQLFNLDTQTGAPPDMFSDDGQNWGFPTYNWEAMRASGYAWWRARLQHLAQYFHAYRIDHILGFFRIWEIPLEHQCAILGHFSPALPLSRSELLVRGVGDVARLTRPHITHAQLRTVFGDAATAVAAHCLQPLGPGTYALRPPYDTEHGIRTHTGAAPVPGVAPAALAAGLTALVRNVVLLPAGHDHFHPRILLERTQSFQDLDASTRSTLWALYVDYYFRRQDALWRDTALERLPALISATDMLVCGEDLGMVPHCVEDVMARLRILSLRIQRMPADPKQEFGDPSTYPHLSVCAPSSHDTSTVRGWWEEDAACTQRFYNGMLQRGGAAPPYADTSVCSAVLQQHLASPSMLAIVPLQELFALFPSLKVPDPRSEQINVPAVAQHYWRYRMHISIPELARNDEFCGAIADMVAATQRDMPY